MRAVVHRQLLTWRNFYVQTTKNVRLAHETKPLFRVDRRKVPGRHAFDLRRNSKVQTGVDSNRQTVMYTPVPAL